MLHDLPILNLLNLISLTILGERYKTERPLPRLYHNPKTGLQTGLYRDPCGSFNEPQSRGLGTHILKSRPEDFHSYTYGSITGHRYEHQHVISGSVQDSYKRFQSDTGYQNEQQHVFLESVQDSYKGGFSRTVGIDTSTSTSFQEVCRTVTQGLFRTLGIDRAPARHYTKCGR